MSKIKNTIEFLSELEANPLMRESDWVVVDREMLKHLMALAARFMKKPPRRKPSDH